MLTAWFQRMVGSRRRHQAIVAIDEIRRMVEEFFKPVAVLLRPVRGFGELKQTRHDEARQSDGREDRVHEQKCEVRVGSARFSQCIGED
jgi:hypothetical protein